MVESRTFEAMSDWEALRTGRMLCGFADDGELTSALVTDEHGRVVWASLKTVEDP